MNILITGSRAPVALDLARRFALVGHNVWMGDSLRHTLGSYSRFIQSNILLPRPVASPRDYRASIMRTVAELKIDRIIPTCEEIFFYDDAWSSNELALRATGATLEQIHNKFSFSKIVEQNAAFDVSAPETHLLATQQDKEAFGMRTQDWVFKPVYSRFASQTLIGPCRSEFVEKVMPVPSYPWIAQRRIHGTEYSTYAVAQAGELKAFCCYHSIYKAGKGSGIYFVPHEDDRIERFVSHLVGHLRFTGQLGLDLIQDNRGSIWILEGNPRATSGVHLFDATDNLVSALLNTSPELVTSKISRPVSLGFAMPIWGLMHACKSGRLSRFLGDWLRSKDAVFAWHDLGPSFAVGPALIELLSICIRERRTLAEASTYDIEWNGESLE